VTDPAPRVREPVGAQAIFDSLDDRGKVAFAQKELDEVYEGLDRIIKKISGIKVRAEDPDGVVAVTLGCDGRMIGLWMDPGAPSRFTNLELEQKLSDVTKDALKEVQVARAEIMATMINYLPPG
jgi:DNA-binding protein YbaB